MTTDATIRAWARDEGMEVPARGRLAPTWREQYLQAHPDEVDEEPDGDEPEGEQAPALPAAAELETGETPPRSPRPAKLLSFRRKKAGGRPPRRISLESVCAGAWSVLSAAAAQGGLTPTSR